MSAPTEHTTRWFEYDSPPVIEHYNDHGGIDRFDPDYTGLPDLPVWREALARVMASVDEATCDLASLSDDATGQMCANPIGYVLHEYEDDNGRENARIDFRLFALVGVSTGVAAVCEDCSPATLYEAAVHAAAAERRG